MEEIQKERYHKVDSPFPHIRFPEQRGWNPILSRPSTFEASDIVRRVPVQLESVITPLLLQLLQLRLEHLVGVDGSNFPVKPSGINRGLRVGSLRVGTGVVLRVAVHMRMTVGVRVTIDAITVGVAIGG